MEEIKNTHPWLTPEIMRLTEEQEIAEGTEQKQIAIENCSAEISKSRFEYTARKRQEMKDMPKGSRLWWRTSAEALGKPARVCSIPALKNSDRAWVTEPRAIATLLAKTFAAKGHLPPKETNKYFKIVRKNRNQELVMPVAGVTLKILKLLNATSGTGNDDLPSKILKECAEELAIPITILVIRIIAHGKC